MTTAKTNYDKVRAAYLKNQRKQQSKDARVWTPDGPGRYPIRILPPWPGGDVWYYEYGCHYRVRKEDEGGGAPVTCPRLTVKKKCPICEFVRGLYQNGEDADRATARDIRGVKRFRSNIVLTDKPGEARIYPYGQKVWEQLSELCVGEDGGIVPIDDPEAGYNLTLVVTQVKTEDGRTFPQYLVKPSMKPTALADVSVLKSLHDLPSSIDAVESYDATKAILMGTSETNGQEPAAASEAAPGEEPTEEVVSDTEATDGSPQDVIAKARQSIRDRKKANS